MNPFKKMDNSQLEKLYQKLKQLDENKKFRKTIDKRQVVLEQCIARAERKQKCSNQKN